MQLPVDIKLQLFDVLVKPVLLYGCEVRTPEGVGVLEKLHLWFCKSRMIMFWTEIIRPSEQIKLSNAIYQLLLKLYNDGIFESQWITSVKSTLESCGFPGVWRNEQFRAVREI